MNFRKKIKLTERVSLNINKTQLSLTIKIASGISLNIGTKGVFLNTSIGNTGLYDRTKIIDIDAKEIKESKPNAQSTSNYRIEEIKNFSTTGEPVIEEVKSQKISNEKN